MPQGAAAGRLAYGHSASPIRACRPHHTTSPSRCFPCWRGPPGGLLCRQLQHGLNRGSSGHVDQLVAGHPALLDQIHHRQQLLPVFRKELAQLTGVHLSVLIDRVIVSFHGGSPFRFGDTILIKEPGRTAAQLQTVAANIATGQWHSITITAKGAAITASVDGVALINYTDPSPLLTGEVVLSGCCDAGGIEDFDNVLVSAVADTFPAQITAVVNAASQITPPTSPVSPGEIVVIYGNGFGPSSLILAQPQDGTFPTSLGGITVDFGTTPAPLIYIASGQIAAVVPYEVSGQFSTPVQVSYAGGSTTPFTVSVVSTQPGIFSLDSSGTGGAAILNQDYSVNSPSNPAAPGAVIIVYETGEGQTNPPGIDGMLASASLPKPIAPVSVLIGGVPAKFDYAGAAPDEVAGLMQLNVEVPANAPTGGQIPVLVIVGQYITQSELTIAIH